METTVKTAKKIYMETCLIFVRKILSVMREKTGLDLTQMAGRDLTSEDEIAFKVAKKILKMGECILSFHSNDPSSLQRMEIKFFEDETISVTLKGSPTVNEFPKMPPDSMEEENFEAIKEHFK